MRADMLSTVKLPRIIFFVGMDGAGKTLYANMLLEELKRRGVDCRHVWSRYNNYLSKPLLGLTRLTGHNYKEYHDGIEFGYHEFGSSRIISYLFITLQMIDANLATLFKICRPSKKNRVLVCDRGPYDTIVDVMLDTGKRNFDNKCFRSYLAFLPKDHIVFYIHRPIREIYDCRPELKHDRSLPVKNKLYEELCADFGWKRIENTASPSAVFKRMFCLLRGLQ